MGGTGIAIDEATGFSQQPQEDRGNLAIQAFRGRTSPRAFLIHGYLRVAASGGSVRHIPKFGKGDPPCTSELMQVCVR